MRLRLACWRGAVVLIGYDISKARRNLCRPTRNVDQEQAEQVIAAKKDALRPRWNWGTQSELHF